MEEVDAQDPNQSRISVVELLVEVLEVVLPAMVVKRAMALL